MKKIEIPKISDTNKPKGLRMYYYTLLDNKMRPRATVCLISYNLLFARGISLCATKEFLEGGFKDEFGRDQARHRAMKAWNRKAVVDKTLSLGAWASVASIPLTNLGVRSYVERDIFFAHKGFWNAKPTAMEKRLMKE